MNDKNDEGLVHIGKTIADVNARMEAHIKAQIEAEKLLPVCQKCGMKMREGYCESCREDETRRQLRLAEAWALDEFRLGGVKARNIFTLETFTNKAAVALCAGYPKENLFIWGPAGTGKTHLATALVRRYPEARVVKPQAIYRECRGLITVQEEQAVLTRFIHFSPYLVIDDLGVDRKTDFSFSVLYEIIEGRDMNLKTGLIITSNLSLDALTDRMNDDRITSRIAGLCKVILLTGKDYRITGGK